MAYSDILGYKCALFKPSISHQHYSIGPTCIIYIMFCFLCETLCLWQQFGFWGKAIVELVESFKWETKNPNISLSLQMNSKEKKLRSIWEGKHPKLREIAWRGGGGGWVMVPPVVWRQWKLGERIEEVEGKLGKNCMSCAISLLTQHIKWKIDGLFQSE